MSSSNTSAPSGQWQPPALETMQAMLPQYAFEALLGRGGMGAVYKAVQITLQRPVAIKVLPGDLAQDDDIQFAERFKNEALTMAKLSHPNIVDVYDFGQTQTGLLYIVMQFVDGTDVAQMIISEGRLPEDYALSITAHVCDALAYAHKNGVVHRDIKPANILIDKEGSVKVADFGLAKANDGGHGLTKTNIAMGTPDFVAPEALIAGIPLDGRADLYAVGVMLYQMLTGEIPRGLWTLPGQRIGTDPRFDGIITRAMQTDRAQRYQSAAELRQDLDSIITLPREVLIAQQQAAAEATAAATRAEKQAQATRAQQQQQQANALAAQRRSAAQRQSPALAATKTASKLPLVLVLALAAIGLGAMAYLSKAKTAAPASLASATTTTPEPKRQAQGPAGNGPKGQGPRGPGQGQDNKAAGRPKGPGPAQRFSGVQLPRDLRRPNSRTWRFADGQLIAADSSNGEFPAFAVPVEVRANYEVELAYHLPQNSMAYLKILFPTAKGFSSVQMHHDRLIIYPNTGRREYPLTPEQMRPPGASEHPRQGPRHHIQITVRNGDHYELKLDGQTLMEVPDHGAPELDYWKNLRPNHVSIGGETKNGPPIHIHSIHVKAL